ncbi:hypothetical protein THASP1DRAFT_22745 [Thamnocephalis sphaerospora]|uniref:Uncharacterized protein n=1 Tax=Thamnocephalis sphaerospora TaxID=78915 RepID=A0A4P9XTC6_9FUNG|nr:hypothetical protein THASP1DRAFT_22745 [Thamnocephalis sphaerospora]|eukprot:RKP09424.1 hypothetical protein THASP1DRAFT_22745 [Thamnocephalis sphaerospora]
MPHQPSARCSGAVCFNRRKPPSARGPVDRMLAVQRYDAWTPHSLHRASTVVSTAVRPRPRIRCAILGDAKWLQRTPALRHSEQCMQTLSDNGENIRSANSRAGQGGGRGGSGSSMPLSDASARQCAPAGCAAVELPTDPIAVGRIVAHLNGQPGGADRYSKLAQSICQPRRRKRPTVPRNLLAESEHRVGERAGAIRLDTISARLQELEAEGKVTVTTGAYGSNASKSRGPSGWIDRSVSTVASQVSLMSAASPSTTSAMVAIS